MIDLYFSSASWGDSDGDGDLDILISGTDDGTNPVAKIYINNGDNTFTEQTDLIAQEIHGPSVAWGDYDNDSYPDLLLAGWSGSDWLSKIYRNNGNNSFTEQSGILLTGVQDHPSAAWGDFDNDGYLDILLTGSSSSGSVSKVYRNNGNNTF